MSFLASMELWSCHCDSFTPDRKVIHTGSEDKSLRVWNPKPGESIHVVQGHHLHGGLLTCMSFTNDSRVAMVSSVDARANLVYIRKVVRLWDHRTGARGMHEYYCCLVIDMLQQVTTTQFV